MAANLLPTGLYFGIPKKPLPCPEDYVLCADHYTWLLLIAPDGREYVPEFNSDQTELLRAYKVTGHHQCDLRYQLHFKPGLDSGPLFQNIATP